jgi:hypothetical protein
MRMNDSPEAGLRDTCWTPDGKRTIGPDQSATGEPATGQCHDSVEECDAGAPAQIAHIVATRYVEHFMVKRSSDPDGARRMGNRTRGRHKSRCKSRTAFRLRETELRFHQRFQELVKAEAVGNKGMGSDTQYPGILSRAQKTAAP